MKTILLCLFVLCSVASGGEPSLSAVVVSLHRDAVPLKDFIVERIAGVDQIVKWSDALGAQPTPEEIAAARTTLAAVETIRGSLLVEFAKLSPEQKAFYQPAYAAVKTMLDSGNVAGAKNIVTWLRAPTDDLAAAQQRMLALFP